MQTGHSTLYFFPTVEILSNFILLFSIFILLLPIYYCAYRYELQAIITSFFHKFRPCNSETKSSGYKIRAAQKDRRMYLRGIYRRNLDNNKLPSGFYEEEFDLVNKDWNSEENKLIIDRTINPFFWKSNSISKETLLLHPGKIEYFQLSNLGFRKCLAAFKNMISIDANDYPLKFVIGKPLEEPASIYFTYDSFEFKLESLNEIILRAEKWIQMVCEAIVHQRKTLLQKEYSELYQKRVEREITSALRFTDKFIIIAFNGLSPEQSSKIEELLLQCSKINFRLKIFNIVGEVLKPV